MLKRSPRLHALRRVARQETLQKVERRRVVAQLWEAIPEILGLPLRERRLVVGTVQSKACGERDGGTTISSHTHTHTTAFRRRCGATHRLETPGQVSSCGVPSSDRRARPLDAGGPAEEADLPRHVDDQSGEEAPLEGGDSDVDDD